jgi:misacylated tRNA(Ala) deacylase
MTDLLYLTDAYLREFDAEVVSVREETNEVALDRTAFFPTGGGQPHDTGELAFADATAAVVDVDWPRRYLTMRVHTAQHIMNGIIWRDHGAHVTGAQITPPEGRLDFELAAMSQEFARSLEAAINEVVRQDLPVRVLWLPRAEADRDPSLIRLKANLIPRAIDPLRVIDIVGLDRQADGGTHVASTNEVGAVRVVKTESKGKANKRVRIAVE